ncbi:hypothetical protein [Legionella gresilensis]|uniref:hypothetical protein n=1 Tax=Legionella gresilensis TaxID=91823 RepID=UPI0010413A71|nr:hypothetical protein [Legionella gresilensis]
MSEKQQGTAYSMREKMLNRYGDSIYHKHNKNHLPYRKHSRTHPVKIMEYENGEAHEDFTNFTGTIKLRKIRKRLDNGHDH